MRESLLALIIHYQRKRKSISEPAEKLHLNLPLPAQIKVSQIASSPSLRTSIVTSNQTSLTSLQSSQYVEQKYDSRHSPWTSTKHRFQNHRQKRQLGDASERSYDQAHRDVLLQAKNGRDEHVEEDEPEPDADVEPVELWGLVVGPAVHV